MKKPAKRNKKYDPNKISKLVSLKAAQEHELWMYYDNDLIDRITAKWLETNPEEDVPTKLLYPHIKGDLIIAIKHRLISMCQKWSIRMDFFIRNTETGDEETVELLFDLPKVEMKEIKSEDSTIKILRDGGFKTRWEGLDKEVEKALKPLEQEGFECLRTFAHISVRTPFKSKADYSYFIQEKALRLTLGEMVG